MRRVFMGWDEPALPLAAGVLCDHYSGDLGTATTPGVLRLDGALVALPGARAGRRLKELLVAESARRSVPLVPPRVTTIGALPELLHDPQRPVSSPVLARRVWAEVLEAHDAEALGAVFARLPDHGALPEWVRLGREIQGLHRAVAAGGLRFADVAERCCDSPLFDDAARWRVLTHVQEGYEARLADLGLVDPDLARLAALEDGRIGTDLDLWLVGVAEMPGVVRRFVAAADAAAGSDGREVRALVHAPAERADAFDALGCVVPEAWVAAEIPLDEARLEVVDRPADQAEAAARTLRSLGGRYAADEVVMGVPDSALVPYLEQRLEAGGVAAREAAGTPVSRTGPFRLLSGVADYLDGRRFDTLAALARHPDLGRWLAEPGAAEPAMRRPDGWLAPLDRWFNEHLPARVPRRSPRAGAAASSEDPESRSRTAADRAVVAALLHRVDGLLGPFAGTRPVSHWAERALELLETIYDGRALKPDAPAHRRLVRALALIGRSARSAIELPGELDTPCGAPEALRLVLDEAAGESIPPAAERAAVELLGWLELHLDDAPVAIVTGMNEPYVPESISAHAFLPDGLRTLLGLLDNDGRYARDAYQLTAMLHARPHLCLVSGRRTATGDPLRPSRLLFAADPETVAKRVRRFYDDEYEEYRGVAVKPAEAAAPADPEGEPESSVLPGSLFRLPPEPVIQAPTPLTRLRATDFRALLDDPYSFALDRVLGLRSIDDAARELDPLRFGTLAHRVLERFGGDREVVNRPDPEAIRRRLDELLDEEVGRRFGRNAHVAVGIQVDQLRARLHAFASWHAAWIGDGWEVVAVECSTPDAGIPLEVDGEPCGISARIDRVDHHARLGEWAVFDYKTGDAAKTPKETHRRNRDQEWADLQLPLYHWLLPRLTGPDGQPIAPGALPADIRVGYVVLPRELDEVGALFGDWPLATLADALKVASDLIRLVRANRFEHDRSAKPRYPDPPLEALLGIGQLATAHDREDS